MGKENIELLKSIKMLCEDIHKVLDRDACLLPDEETLFKANIAYIIDIIDLMVLFDKNDDTYCSCWKSSQMLSVEKLFTGRQMIYDFCLN